MNILKRIVFFAAISLASTGVSAEVVKGDWKSAGDNLSVVDTETGIEWLSLTQTDGLSIASVQSQLLSTFSGWRLPTEAEVSTMIKNVTGFESDAATVYGTQYASNTSKFINALGTTYQSNYLYSFGLALSDEQSTITTSVYYSGVSHSSQYNDYAIRKRQGVSDNINYSHSSYGVYLVSDGGVTLSSINDPGINAMNANSPANVPIPATALLFGLGGLLFMRKNKN